MITQDSCKKMHDRLQEPCMITQDSFIRFMHENVPKSCTHMHDLTQVSCMNLAKMHNMIMQEIFAWVRPDVLVKGGDYAAETILGKEFAGEIRIYSFMEGVSSTAFSCAESDMDCIAPLATSPISCVYM